MDRLRCVLLATTVALSLPALATKLPQPSEGNVNGLQGVIFLPVTIVNDESRVLDPGGCKVYLVPPAVDNRLVYECGTWFAPPPARYTIWIEQGHFLSGQTVLSYPGSRFADNGMVVEMPLEDAGFVKLAADTALRDDATVRFLSLEPSATGFDKRLQAREARAETRLPVGKAMAGVFDADGNTLALSRPFVVNGRQPVTGAPKPPDRGTDLMVVLGKHQARSHDRSKRATTVSVLAGGVAKAPDVFYETDGRIIAVWYGLEEDTATIKAASDLFQSPEKSIRLARGEVTTFRGELSLK